MMWRPDSLRSSCLRRRFAARKRWAPELDVATQRGFQEIPKAVFCGGPVADREGVVHRVADEAIAHDGVRAQDAVAHGAESFHGTLRAKISCVGIQFDSVGQKRFEGVMEQKILRCGVDVSSPVRRPEPCLS
jgi:hypothetical protein